ncbi:MAG: 4Fe-4S binding protein, partial [Candidatus Solibacter usitatus]|nr:4Fe-4S binding protein [Candidatus Solibacter usitatus]
EFVRFVHYYESGGASPRVTRPPGVEGWLPIAALMNLKYLIQTAEWPAVHPAGLLLLIAFLAVSVAFRKSFCSWLCPVGTLSEWLWKIGKEAFGRNWKLPRWVDIPLRGLKYILLGLFLYAVGSMTSPAIHAFLKGPYGQVADVKMLDFFRYLSLTAAITLAVVVALSFFVQNFWCRYLCPYGALMGLAALFSPARIRRDAGLCIDCAKCAKACPSLLPVDKLVAIRSAECTGCLDCVLVCPVEGALKLSVGRRRSMPPWLVAAGIAVVFFGACIYGRLSGHWHTLVPEEVYFQLIPHARELAHP